MMPYHNLLQHTEHYTTCIIVWKLVWTWNECSIIFAFFRSKRLSGHKTLFMGHLRQTSPFCNLIILFRNASLGLWTLHQHCLTNTHLGWRFHTGSSSVTYYKCCCCACACELFLFVMAWACCEVDKLNEKNMFHVSTICKEKSDTIDGFWIIELRKNVTKLMRSLL